MRYPGDVIMPPVLTPPPANGTREKVSLQVVQTDIQTGSEVVSKDYLISRNAPSYSYGKETGGNWNPIAQNTIVSPGDILRFTYSFRVPFFEEWQTKRFITSLEEDDRYEIRHFTLSEEEGKLWVEVKVIKQDFGLTAIAIGVAIAAIGIGIGFWLVTEGIEKLGNSATSSPSISFLLIAGGLALILFTYAKVKSA